MISDSCPKNAKNEKLQIADTIYMKNVSLFDNE